MALPDTLVVATSVDRQLGTLQEEGQVRALTPQTGELRWSRDFAKEIPVHLQVGPDGSSWIGFAPHGAKSGPFPLRRLGAATARNCGRSPISGAPICGPSPWMPKGRG